LNKCQAGSNILTLGIITSFSRPDSARFNSLPASCRYLQSVDCNLPSVICHLLSAICYLQSASCLLPVCCPPSPTRTHFHTHLLQYSNTPILIYSNTQILSRLPSHVFRLTSYHLGFTQALTSYHLGFTQALTQSPRDTPAVTSPYTPLFSLP